MAGMGSVLASPSVVAAAERKAISQSVTSQSISRTIIQSISPHHRRKRELRTLVIVASALLRGAVLASHRRRIAAHGRQGRAHDVADVTQRLAQLLDQVRILAALLFAVDALLCRAA